MEFLRLVHDYAAGNDTADRNALEASFTRARGNVLFYRGRNGDLHDLRRRLHLLHREELERADASAGPQGSDLQYHLPAFSSSLTIHLSVRALHRGKIAAFNLFWFLTLILGAIFLIGTGREWHRLIYGEGLTISTNLFGTTYYSLVGLHAFHVSAGLLGLGIVMVLSIAARVKQQDADRVEVFSLYWHFVDAVWIVVFTVVYIVGR